RMAAQLEGRVRLDAEVRSVAVTTGSCTVELASGEELRADAVVSALPVSILALVDLDGVSNARVRSLRSQRHALAAKLLTVYDHSVWADVGANGLSEGEHLLASTWPQREGVLSGLVPPERIGWLLALAEEDREPVLHAELGRMYGLAAAE